MLDIDKMLAIIEGYRASDGQHLGAFDPKTGNQLKPADPKRNIKNTCKDNIMGLKIDLTWFDKKTESFIGEEYSVDLGDDDTVIEQTVNPTENIINAGSFDVISAWVPYLQKYIKHKIELNKYDYQVAFDYRDKW
ncbi:colicin immunity protein [Proteus mirabilis]|nr:colicin immunity protein [Proteus mirabilis]